MHHTMGLGSVRLRGVRGLIGLLTVASVAIIGCGRSQPAQYAVDGHVSFQGSPVEEGQVTFENPASGFANSVAIGPGGVYATNLSDGSYRVSIEPPRVQIDAGPNSPPSEGYKNVKNIPAKYRNSNSSKLTVQVSGGKVTQDFQMTP